MKLTQGCIPDFSKWGAAGGGGAQRCRGLAQNSSSPLTHVQCVTSFGGSGGRFVTGRFKDPLPPLATPIKKTFQNKQIQKHVKVTNECTKCWLKTIIIMIYVKGNVRYPFIVWTCELTVSNSLTTCFIFLFLQIYTLSLQEYKYRTHGLWLTTMNNFPLHSIVHNIPIADIILIHSHDHMIF